MDEQVETRINAVKGTHAIVVRGPAGLFITGRL